MILTMRLDIPVAGTPRMIAGCNGCALPAPKGASSVSRLGGRNEVGLRNRRSAVTCAGDVRLRRLPALLVVKLDAPEALRGVETLPSLPLQRLELLAGLGRKRRHGRSDLPRSSGCYSELSPNKQFQRSVNSRLWRLLPPAELGRWALSGEPSERS